MGLRRFCLVTVVLPSLFCAATFAEEPPEKSATTKPAAKPQGPKPKSETTILAEQLSSDDATVQQQALDRIKELLAKSNTDDIGRPKPQTQVDPQWIKSLIKVRRYDDAEALALTGILRKPGSPTVSMLQKARVQALLAAGKHDAALAAAKSYYNVCPMKETSAAIEQVSLCLINARPDEKGLAKKFKTQQIAAATTQPSTQPAVIEDNVLKTITVDGKPYDQALQAIAVNGLGDLIAKGNLLLLADRAKEAKECFESASDLAQTEKDNALVIEAMARAIRAETGSVGAANGYILAQQGNQ